MSITFNDYQRFALSKRAPKFGLHSLEQLVVCTMGMAGESGEALDLTKKLWAHDHDFTVEVEQKLVKEIGDVLWYCAVLSSALNKDLSEIVEKNIQKLTGRYPDGFSVERSVNRPVELTAQDFDNLKPKLEPNVLQECVNCEGQFILPENSLAPEHFWHDIEDKYIKCPGSGVLMKQNAKPQEPVIDNIVGSKPTGNG